MISKKENPFYNITFNVLLPVYILNKGEKFFSTEHANLYALLVALSLPLLYGLYDYVKSKKVNVISVLSLVGILLTGGFALFQFKGIYFAIKEGALPFLIALITLASVPYKKPLIYLLLFESHLLNKNLIEQKIKEHKKEKEFQTLMNKTTVWLSYSFILSAILNFTIGFFVFKEIDPALSQEIQRKILNEQIADMTWMGYLFIALPLSFITIFIFWTIMKNLKNLTGFDFQKHMN